MGAFTAIGTFVTNSWILKIASIGALISNVLTIMQCKTNKGNAIILKNNFNLPYINTDLFDVSVH